MKEQIEQLAAKWWSRVAVKDIFCTGAGLLLFAVTGQAQQRCTSGTVTGTYKNGDTKQAFRCPARIPVGAVVTITTTDTPITPTILTVLPGIGTLAAAVTRAILLAKTAPVTLQLSAGDYTSNLTLPRTGAPYPITITAASALLPAAGTRINATATLPRIVPALTGEPTIVVQGDNYVLRGLNVVGGDVGVTTIDIDAAATPRPSNLVFDQLVIRGSATTGGHRGIGANGSTVTISNSWIDRMWEVGRDAQAVAIWDTPGPVRIDNNYLEASGENILLGGSIPTCGCVPTDVVITRNTITKDPAWRLRIPAVSVKNLVEVKFGRRVTVTNNDISRNWSQDQTGWSILVTAMGIEGTAWTVIDTVTIANNSFHDLCSGLNIAAVAGPVLHVAVHDNVWRNLDNATWKGAADCDGRWILIQGGTDPTRTVSNVSVTHETVIGLSGNQFLGLDAQPILGFAMTHVVVEHRDYGLFSSDGMTQDALRIHAPGAVFRDNAILGAARPDWTWPVGNFLLDLPVAPQFDASGKLLSTSLLATLKTSDGAQVGAGR